MKKFMTLVISLVLFFSYTVSIYSQDILSEPTATEYQCIRWLKDKNASDELVDLVPFIFKESIAAKVDPILVIVQTSLETNYFKSSLCINNHNTAGIKQRNNTNKYAYYDSYEDGLKAQIAHLALYSGNPQDWYYYSSGLDGWVTTVDKLSGTWAENKEYGNNLLKMMNQIYSYEVKHESISLVEKEETNDKVYKNKLYEILDRKNKHSNGIDLINEILRRN